MIERCYLAEIAIQDFAVIERLQVELQPGFCVLTGETGAGKSLIIEALGAALGDRASSEWIRAGTDRAHIEAVFAFPRAVPELVEVLAEWGSPADEGNLILHREVQVGRSVTRVDGRAAPGHMLEEIGTRLVDVHSQVDHVALSRPRMQLEMLDRFGQLGALRAQMAKNARELRSVRDQLRQLEAERLSAEREASLLRHEVEEIEAAALRAGEDEELTARRARLRNALRLRGLLEDANRALFGDGGVEGALELVGNAAIAFREIRQLDAGLPVSEEQLIEVIDTLEGLQRLLRSYEEVLEDDPQALDAIEERLLMIADLKRKYGVTVEEVLAHEAEGSRRLGLVDDAARNRGELERQEASLANQAAELALALSMARVEAAGTLEASAEAHIRELGMPGARFRVQLLRRAGTEGLRVDGGIVEFDETGIDQLEFLVAANPGEPERPIGKAASGGELSRIMLAVKAAVARVDPVPVLVFDELDQGVGGRMGHVIGEKLWQLSRGHQVLCITHLPQVACYADHHYAVTKELADGRATTAVRRVEGPDRVAELALMLAGVRAGEAAHEGARELLEAATEWKRARTEPGPQGDG
ncbi:MAG: DNA repair protein RecN [Chloroflexi bacterium]|nr:DNA repair protein RecN [Chloroflexota bacterium]